MRRALFSMLVLLLTLAASPASLRAEVPVTQKKFYQGLLKSWVKRNPKNISAYFDIRVTLDLGPHCRKGKYKKRQAIGVLRTHLNRHVMPDPRLTKILKMTGSYMLMRHHYKDLVTGQRKQQHLLFKIRKSGGAFIVTEIRP